MRAQGQTGGGARLSGSLGFMNWKTRLIIESNPRNIVSCDVLAAVPPPIVAQGEGRLGTEVPHSLLAMPVSRPGSVCLP